jgi:hypothetical protein
LNKKRPSNSSPPPEIPIKNGITTKTVTGLQQKGITTKIVARLQQESPLNQDAAPFQSKKAFQPCRHRIPIKKGYLKPDKSPDYKQKNQQKGITTKIVTRFLQQESPSNRDCHSISTKNCLPTVPPPDSDQKREFEARPSPDYKQENQKHSSNQDPCVDIPPATPYRCSIVV